MSNKRHVIKCLTNQGDGTGNRVQNGDYSSSPEIIYYKNTTGHIVEIHRMIVKIEDSGSFDASFYGNGITLVNGVRVLKKGRDDNDIQEMTAYPIMHSGDWAGHCHDVTLHAFGQGNGVMSIRWTFAKAGRPVRLDHEESIAVILNDDFRDLIDHHFMIQGIETI